MRIRKILQWLSRRSVVLITALLIAVGILLAWFLSAGFAPGSDRITIGLAAVAAFLAAISAIASLLQAVEVQKQRQSQERPYITAHFDGTSSGAICFLIENVGNSPALDVRFRFTPAPVDFAGRPLSEVSLFANPITFLPAGKMIRQVLDAGYRFLAEGKPARFSVTVSYRSIWGEIYEETIDHNLEYLKQATVPGRTVEDHLKTISEQLKSLVQLVQNSRGLDSFLVETPEQYYSRMNDERQGQANQPRWKRMVQKWLQWVLSK